MFLEGKHSIRVSPVAAGGRGRKENPACLSVWHPDYGGGGFWVGFDLREGGPVTLLVSDPGAATSPLPRSLYDRSFFLVFFGAATKCAMCYVAWFILFFYFLQATKLICSPIVKALCL